MRDALNRIFVIGQLAPRSISDKEMKTRLEQHFNTFITKFIPLSERQNGNEESNPDSKPMKFCTKCHKSFHAGKHFPVFRCVLASLKEGVSVCPSVSHTQVKSDI